jgi:hypothetical protein
MHFGMLNDGLDGISVVYEYMMLVGVDYVFCCKASWLPARTRRL